MSSISVYTDDVSVSISLITLFVAESHGDEPFELIGTALDISALCRLNNLIISSAMSYVNFGLSSPLSSAEKIFYSTA